VIPMADTAIDAQYNEFRRMIGHFEATGEVSLQTSASAYLRKVLLLSAASYFEHKVTETMLDFVAERVNSDVAIISLVKSKVISRQYHSYFAWDRKNANAFFSMFGPDFSAHMESIVKSDDRLD
jgi:hypothetical protein